MLQFHAPSLKLKHLNTLTLTLFYLHPDKRLRTICYSANAWYEVVWARPMQPYNVSWGRNKKSVETKVDTKLAETWLWLRRSALPREDDRFHTRWGWTRKAVPMKLQSSLGRHSNSAEWCKPLLGYNRYRKIFHWVWAVQYKWKYFVSQVYKAAEWAAACDKCEKMMFGDSNSP